MVEQSSSLGEHFWLPDEFVGESPLAGETATDCSPSPSDVLIGDGNQNSDDTLPSVPERFPTTESAANVRPIAELTADIGLREETKIAQPDLGAPLGSGHVVMTDVAYHNGSLRFAYSNPALGFRHHPLYFEDVALERYGLTAGYWDPAFSMAHFLKSTFFLPYRLLVTPPCSTVTTYGPR